MLDKNSELDDAGEAHLRQLDEPDSGSGNHMTTSAAEEGRGGEGEKVSTSQLRDIRDSLQ